MSPTTQSSKKVKYNGQARRLNLQGESGDKSNYEVIRNSEKISTILMKYPSAFALDTKKIKLEEMIASEKSRLPHTSF